MEETVNKTRKVDPFFEDAINQIFIQSEKTAFVMDGPIGIGKSSNFVMQGAYNISQLVEPIKKGKKMVRESRWAAVRESENSASATIQQLLTEAIFTPEIVSMEDSPVKVSGSHPVRITVEHELPDGTHLEMHIECHGFNNPKAHNRLRTHEFMGAMIFEMQGIPFNIFEVTMQRCGRFRTNDLVIKKTIDGKEYQLSGLSKLAMVLCDVNIPERPHEMYAKYYDVADKSKLPYVFLTPPSPIIPVDVNKVSDEILNKYPVGVYDDKDVVWLPNPKAYNMTRHFEEKDSNGVNIPWTGYDYWFNKLHLTESEITRYIRGRPDTLGGKGAVYGKFKKNNRTVVRKQLDYNRPVWVGYDPGSYAAVELAQLLPGDHLHFFKEFNFEPGDHASTRVQFADFVFPYMIKHLKGTMIYLVLDPASSWLGKNNITGSEETVVNMIGDEIAAYRDKFEKARITIKIVPCLIANQNVSARIGSLNYFIDKHALSVDPSCETLITSLAGGYRKKELKSGIISDNIDKDNPYSHPAEAAQYPTVNIINQIKKAKRNGNKDSSKRRRYKIRSTRN